MQNKIDIVTERPWFSPAIIRILETEGFFNHVYTGFPKGRFSSTGVSADRIFSRPVPAVWNYAVKKSGFSFLPAFNEPRAMGTFVARQKKLAPVISCLGTSYQYLFPKIATRPIIRVVECGSMHPEDNYWLQQQGRSEAGLRTLNTLPSRIATECEVAQMAHFHICGSRMIAESYLVRGYSPERILHCSYGTDTDRFRFIQRRPPDGRPLRIATVGVIGIRKGIARLISIVEWAQRAGINMEIHLIGPVDAEVEHLIKRSRGRFIKHGVLKGQSLVHALHQADVYCLPSYEEGFGVSIVEAMATGLPAIVSDKTGGKEAIIHGVNGMILANFDDAEFEERLKPWLLNPEILLSAGRAATKTVCRDFSLEAYADRVKECYLSAIELSNRLLRGEPVATAFPSPK